ncbi:MAG: hypothetical protein ACKOA8_18055, partial [Deltaproteobacteria bacterium]
MKFEQATQRDRDCLAGLRASAWAKELSPQEFSERNKLLYAHPFGQKRIQTFLLRDKSGEIVSSMDALEVKLFFRAPLTQEVQNREGFLIASVITPENQRAKGYATQLLQNFLSHQKWDLGVLYSDIGAPYYERFGFKKTPTSVFEVQGFESNSKPKLKILSLEAWVEKVFQRRKENFENNVKAQVALLPETEFLDWQLERFRYFFRLTRAGVLPPCFYECETPQGARYFAVVHNPVTQGAEILWREPDCPEIFSFIASVVQGWGLKKYSYWSSGKETGLPGRKVHEECPMGW